MNKLQCFYLSIDVFFPVSNNLTFGNSTWGWKPFTKKMILNILGPLEVKIKIKKSYSHYLGLEYQKTQYNFLRYGQNLGVFFGQE